MNTMESKGSKHYDVAILGSGIGGAMLGTILARHGVKVLILEQGLHPRFAIGESTIPETTVLMRLISKRYDVPEIGYLSTFHDVRARVSSNCGIKRNFTFCYQRPGEPHRGNETTQLLTWAPPMGPDVHFYRQDIDAYMMMTAVKYGVTVMQQTRMTDIEIDENSGVRMTTDKAGDFTADFVVDAGGMFAPVAQKLGLRQNPSPLTTRSRALYTHMIGVTPYDQISPSKDDHGLLSPLSQGTLHHVFKEGWMWVIAFNNHARSTNPLVSVGMLLNMDLCPPTGMPPEQEFFQFINRFPSISKHFQNARSVRPWASFDRLQFSSSRSTGPRYVLLPHASSFVDPLFSSGLAITMSAINNMAHRIITATRTRNYDPENFEYVNTWIHNGFNYYDRLVRNCYTAWQDFDLWNAYHRTWMLGSLYGVSGLIELLLSYEKTGDLKTFDRFETKPYRGIQAFDVDEYMEIFSYLSENVESVKSGERSSAEASGRIWEYLRGNPFCPEPWDLANPNKRVPGALTLPYLYRLRDWGRNRSPDVVRKYFFNTDVSVGFFKDVASNSLSLSRTLDFSTSDMLRDAFVTWNNEWKRSPASSILPNLLS